MTESTQDLASASLLDEVEYAHAWARVALLGEPMPDFPIPPGLEPRRQDAGELLLRQSVRLTPLQIGAKHYEHGLGAHANSEIVVRLAKPGKSFHAEVGIDNNWDTAGKHGTVVFSVDVGGKERFRSSVLKGGDQPVSVDLDLGGAKEFTLLISDSGDGIGWDQSDWANAKVALEDGNSVWLDEMPVRVPPARLATGLPFSFTYDGVPSEKLLPTWKRSNSVGKTQNGKHTETVTFSDPATGLEVICEVTVFAGFPAAEWVMRFHNSGAKDTPILENIRALDLRIATPPKGDIILHHSNGSTCDSTDFIPLDTTVAPSAELNLAPNGGRSSDGVLPFFNLEWHGGGLIGAIGWSGQWAMRVKRDSAREILLQAGQQITHLKLHPGESIRTPRILVIPWRGADSLHGNNLLRRLLLAHYVPRINGKVAVPMMGQLAVDQALNWCNEENQLSQIPRIAKTGAEMFWLDAGWFEGEWPGGAGSWVPKSAFPHGLKPLGDKAHENGMKFILWFEPERVCKGSRIANEFPEWVRLQNGTDWDGLFKLDDPAARKWLTDTLSKSLSDWGVDVYRNDFNIAPLRFWQAADEPDRQGITENHYIEGLYTMWDELRARKPGLTIDNCASGGRRIDIETISRSYPLWRSDTTCAPPVSSAWDQCQTAGLSLYMPLHSAGAWSYDPYAFRSVATTAVVLPGNIWQGDYAFDAAKRATEEVKDLRPLWLGDYYPLLPVNLDESQWCGWQFDRPDLGQGFAMLFRRPKSQYTTVQVALHGLDRKAKYEVTFVDAKKKLMLTGAELATLRVDSDKSPGSVLIKYRKAN
jgi:alpha-galactosidase